ncbi:phosphonate C-P lyase system protein PhnG [Polaromonas sp.]|uniref:phosphonate C-P lyase system protein PhnG n=1 Tax=Polaromonas sp. TaxID=1869339 RepID=UPI002731E105|nr:phosphonate C-P lyase system protein PhnG [Polaromonas sp.]MDP1741375.1 phosphonate C-P lyase system protein PhnG [Polaromonas sp.]
MTKETFTPDTATRRRWLAVLARASRPELEAACLLLGDLPAPDPVRPAEPGMVMLRGRIGGTGDVFNLGEASVTRCALRMGTGALGVGYTLGRDRRKAELIAIIDALLQDPVRHADIVRELVEPLSRQQAVQRDDTSRAAAASKVEFFTFVRGEA